ncbi:hypothetical protein GCM10025868_27390 [Angustibacter aerolatus]|uniref:Uncharacterized protein n=1 Tax=Angustibacter aerolatus TaxID=1162965 RepID=A0ABQ6JJE1_9ACTN|nr:hypothetical protein GCM10025868_27390 [Angustibacter aerolatus]
MDEDCRHGMNPAWCSTCQGHDDAHVARPAGSQAPSGGDSKQDQLDALCRQLRIPPASVGVGSSLPSAVFDSAARACGVRLGSMPEIGQAIATKAGLTWTASCDSRETVSGGGSTVTRDGLEVMNRAVAIILRTKPRDPSN